MHKDLLEIARRVLQTEAEAVGSLIGKSGLVGKKIAATLASTGTPAFFLHPAEATHGDLGMVTAEDVIVAISNSGETEELTGLVPFLKRFDVRLISLTGNTCSTLARAADVNIDISVREEACSLGIVPTSSTTATMAMGDAIAVALLIKRGFGEADFALFHPRGSLGKKLFVRVRDVMQSGVALPMVSPDAPMLSAVMEISSKRLGVTVVHDDDGKLLGIITDGDVRRGVEKWGKAFFDMSAHEVMTRDPRVISGDELAAKALSVMEKLSITSLVVPDEKGGALGIIHLHDILRQGIA